VVDDKLLRKQLKYLNNDQVLERCSSALIKQSQGRSNQLKNFVLLINVFQSFYKKGMLVPVLKRQKGYLPK